MPPRRFAPVRSKTVACCFAMFLTCLLILTHRTFAQETPVQSAPVASDPLIHMVRKTDELSSTSKLKQQSPAAHLNYYGGPVVSNIQVIVVFWGPNVNSTVTTQIGGFFQAITSSSYFDLVSEYSTDITPVGGGTGTNQSIGRGDFGGTYTITPSICSKTPCTVTDAQIKAEILNQVTAGNLPAPELDDNGNVNTLYMTYFPHGVTITQGQYASCAAFGFCAYHGTTSNTFNSKHLLYGVVPDFGPGSGCDIGCGGGTEFENVSSVSSHETIETVTDADVGVATSFAPPLAWYDPNGQDQDGGGEIGDICNAQQAQVSAGGSTYTVQKVWSNFAGACVSIGAHPSFQLTAPASPTIGTSFNFTVTAQNPVGESTDTSFTGTVHFTSSDSQAVLPTDYTFSPADKGTQTFGATLKSAGSQTITATDTVNGAVTGNATLTVGMAVQAPAITSVNNATFTTGAAGTFTVTATGSPVPSLTRTGTLPSGVSFVDNGNGTGTLTGTPAAGTSGTYNIVFRAHNSGPPDATQTFTLTVDAAPGITSANNTTFAMGAAGSFTVTTTGLPIPSLTRTGTLPTGVSFVDNGNGTATLAGTPAAGTSGTYKLVLTAHNSVSPNATQNFTLTVNTAPVITSANNTTFATGTSGSFAVTATGSPIPSLTWAGTLPTGLSFVDNENGTGTLAGLPAAGTNGTYSLVFTAHNTSSPDATQNFTLTVNAAPAITSANNTAFTVGTVGTFMVTASGSPAPSLTRTGTLPTGLSFVDNGNGAGTLAGTPAAGSNGTYNIVLTAHNSVSPDATQNFALTVNAGNQAPAITSANNIGFTTGVAGTFTVAATGSPTPAFIRTGTLPTGVSFVDHRNGTGTLSGTPASGTEGTYSIVFRAHNGVSPASTQNFTLTVSVAPAITSVNNTTFTAGTAGSFMVTATGTPTPTLASTGSLPSGVSFIDNGDGTGTLSGTPAAASPGNYNIVFTAHNGGSPDATQGFTLTVNPGPQAPAIVSANSTVFTAGTPGTFTVSATGLPTPSLTKSGALPGGVTFDDNGNGTATLGGTPTAGGTYNIVIRAHNTASPDATQKFTLTVNTTPSQLSLSPTNLDFGDVNLNATVQKVVTVKNTGGSTLSISKIWLTQSLDNAFTLNTNCGASLLPSKSCTATISFSESVQKTLQATLHFTDDAAGSPQTVAITAHSTDVQLRFSPTALTFSATPAGSNQALTVTMTNIGSSDMPLEKSRFTGTDASDFTYTDNCPTSLAPKTRCTIRVEFAPTATGLSRADLLGKSKWGIDPADDSRKRHRRLRANRLDFCHTLPGASDDAVCRVPAPINENKVFKSCGSDIADDVTLRRVCPTDSAESNS